MTVLLASLLWWTWRMEWENVFYLWQRTSQTQFRWICGPHGWRRIEILGVWFSKAFSQASGLVPGTVLWWQGVEKTMLFPMLASLLFWLCNIPLCPQRLGHCTITHELFFPLAAFYCCYPSRQSISNWMWVLLYAQWIPCVRLLEAIWQQWRQEKLQK